VKSLDDIAIFVYEEVEEVIMSKVLSPTIIIMSPEHGDEKQTMQETHFERYFSKTPLRELELSCQLLNDGD
jgi:hypothetical protein